MRVRDLIGAATALLAGVGIAGCADMAPPRPAATVAAAARCMDDRFPVYFARGSAELTPAAREVIRTASNRVAGCRVTAVDVVGMAAPDAGRAAADPALTQTRADRVAQALAAAGLPAPTFDVQVAGAPPTRPGVRPPARRTEVVLHAQPAGS